MRGTALSAALLMVASACGGPPSSSPGASTSASGQTSGLPALNLANVTTETSAARGAMIGPTGGTITATGSNGATYTLDVPAGALLRAASIAMYPVTKVAGLADGMQINAGAQFTPDGLLLHVPAILTITVPGGGSAAGIRGIAWNGDGSGPHAYPTIADGATVRLLLNHFSGAGVGTENLPAIPATCASPSDLDLMLASDAGGVPLSAASFARDLRECYRHMVVPALTTAIFAAGEDDRTFEEPAHLAYITWLGGIELARDALHNPAFTVSPELEQSRPVAAAFLRAWYDYQNRQCLADYGTSLQVGIADADDALEHHYIAEIWDVATAAYKLDLETALDDLCVQVVIDPSRNYSGARPGESGVVSVKAGFRFGAEPLRFDPPIEVYINLTGESEGWTLRTDGAGGLKQDVDWPNGLDPIRIDIHASLVATDGNVTRIARFDRITKSTGPGGIAWMGNPAGAFQIFSMKADGTGLKAVTTGTGPLTQGWTPVWSPDSQRIAFYQGVVSSSANLMVVNADGTNLALVAAGAAGGFIGRPTWSPDGTKLAFQAVDGHDSEIFVIGVDGSGRTQLTSNDVEDSAPAWSPDGTKIAFNSVRDRNLDIYVMNADGSGEARLTSDPGSDAQPQWAPDGSRIVYDSQRGGVNGIAVMQADGSGQVQLAGGNGGAYASWSPDGSRIVFSASAAGNTTSDLFIMQADGSGVIQLTHNGANNIYPTWSP